MVSLRKNSTQQQAQLKPQLGSSRGTVNAAFRKPQLRSNKLLPLVLAGVAIVSWASFLIAWMQTSLTTTVASAPHPVANKIQKVVDRGLPAREIELFPDNLQHEAFYETLASCVPPPADAKADDIANLEKKKKHKCNLYVPDNGIERIAILSPPGAIGYVFEKFIDEVVRLHATPEQRQKMEFITTSHSLPYGYGKTHGYTKVIRLATLPLRLAASDLVLEQLRQQHSSSTVEEDVTLNDIVQATQQVVRWHCRVSHVSAHTAVLTVSLEDLLDDPWEEEYQVRTFLNLVTASAKEDETNHVDEDELAGSMDEIVHRSTVLLMRLDQLSAVKGKRGQKKMEDVLDEIVNKELSSTKNLDAWPCTSFWQFDDNITPLSKKTAQLFAPNCSAPYTKCFVPRDYCEERGDAKCAKQQK